MNTPITTPSGAQHLLKVVHTSTHTATAINTDASTGLRFMRVESSKLEITWIEGQPWARFTGSAVLVPLPAQVRKVEIEGGRPRRRPGQR